MKTKASAIYKSGMGYNTISQAFGTLAKSQMRAISVSAFVYVFHLVAVNVPYGDSNKMIPTLIIHKIWKGDEPN